MADLTLFNDFFSSASLGSFSEDEKLLYSVIFSTASEEVKTLCDNTDFKDIDDDTTFDEKIEATKQDLKEIIRLFKEAEESRGIFKERFHKWSTRREDNVCELKELASCMDKDRFWCILANVIVGCVALLSCSLLAYWHNITCETVYGSVLSALCGAAIFGTALTDVHFFNKRLNKIKEVIKEEEEDFKLVSKWFKHSQGLIDLFEKILGFSAVKKVFQDFQKFTEEDLKNLTKLWDGKIHSRLKKLIQVCVRQIAPTEIATSCDQLMFLTPIVITLFFVLVLFHKPNNLIFNCVVVSHFSGSNLKKTINLVSGLKLLVYEGVLNSPGIAPAEISKITSRVVDRGVFGSIGLGLDATNLVLATIDIHNGSLRPYINQIRSAAKQLSEEHHLMWCVYHRLFK